MGAVHVARGSPGVLGGMYGGQPPLPLKLRALIDFAVPRLKASLSGASAV